MISFRSHRSAHSRERGATTVIVGMLMTAMLAAVGIGVDTGSMTYQRSRAQHAADAAVSAIAHDCADGKVTCTAAGAQSTADYFVTQNAGSGTATIPGTVNTSSSSVTVNVAKTVNTGFFGMLGIKSKIVRASATASYAGHPTEGTSVLPMAVPYCMYKNNLPPSTTPLLLRSDVVSVVFNVIVQGGVVGRLITNLLGDLLGVTEACTSSTGLNLKMLRGPIWLSGLEGAVNGVFNWNSSICNMHLGTLTGFLGSTISAVIPSNCMNKLGTTIQRGQIVLLPIYEPSISLPQLGLEMDACLLGICSAKIPPRIGVKVLGFAPFKITGWNYSGNSQPDPNAPACASIDLLTHPSASIGCNGIQGYFVKSYSKDPDFLYSPSGADFGAYSVAISN